MYIVLICLDICICSTGIWFKKNNYRCCHLGTKFSTSWSTSLFNLDYGCVRSYASRCFRINPLCPASPFLIALVSVSEGEGSVEERIRMFYDACLLPEFRWGQVHAEVWDWISWPHTPTQTQTCRSGLTLCSPPVDQGRNTWCASCVFLWILLRKSHSLKAVSCVSDMCDDCR